MTPQLTPAQLTTLRNAINADPVLSALEDTPDNALIVADEFNLLASPAFWAWRTKVSKDEYTKGTGPSGTLFDWASAGGFIARSQGERDAWKELFNGTNTTDPSRTNVRAAFDDIFSGTGAGAQNNRTHLAAVSRRRVTRAERLYATGTGSTAVPGLAAVEGLLTYQEVRAARGG